MSCSASAIGIRRGCSKSDIMSNSLFVAEQMSFANHLTSENGKLAALTSGRPAFQQHAEHTKSGDTPPRHAHAESPERRAYKPQFRQKQKRSRSPAGPRRLGTATRISASLLRRLSAFFGSVSDQDPKAAKYAVLIPGHAGFPKRVVRSEGSNSAPIRNAPCFAV